MKKHEIEVKEVLQNIEPENWLSPATPEIEAQEVLKRIPPKNWIKETKQVYRSREGKIVSQEPISTYTWKDKVGCAVVGLTGLAGGGAVLYGFYEGSRWVLENLATHIVK